MNNDSFLLNDTLDNLTFADQYLVNKSTPQHIESLKSEISFNDSIFLSDSQALQENASDKTDNALLSASITAEFAGEESQKSKSNYKSETVSKEIASVNEKQQQVSSGGNTSERHTPESISSEELITIPEDSETNKSNLNKESDINEKALEENSKLSNWGLPDAVLERYQSKKIVKMFRWQVECLSIDRVLHNNANLIYSAPTSAGKTLVAEILAMKTIFERKKKVLFILPFVSIVREKMYYFQDILGSSGIRVEGFMGSYNPPGGFQSIQLAICTIEKANSLINRLLEENKLSDIGAILVDELHLLGDPYRGYILELLLTKLRYISLKDKQVNIQIIGMSATLPNLKDLAKWLDAELYITNFRPIPLYEQALVTNDIYSSTLELTRKLTPLSEIGVDTDNILQLCLETIKESCSVLIFCPTKNWCESLAEQISLAFYKLYNLSSENRWTKVIRSELKPNLVKELLEQLKFCPAGLDKVLGKATSFSVAFHHAGLTMDERDIIEAGFRKGSVRVLIATSTLSSGVNLPARRVIVRTPNFYGRPLDTLTYRQMIGRAGRMGKDTMGESILICQKNDLNTAKQLMSANLQKVESCLEGAGKLKRAILEIITSGVASSPEDVQLFTKCTLLASSESDTESENINDPIDESVEFLCSHQFIRLQKNEDNTNRYVATSLGKACLSSSMPPDEGLALLTELEKARQCFVLETELHLIYLVTPYSACNQWGQIDWMMYLNMWEALPASMKRVGELVGVREGYLFKATHSSIQTNTVLAHNKFLIHKRFFVALALQDLVNEKSLREVCRKFKCNRGMLQSLQQSASSFAGMVTSFSRQLGWSSVEILISQFQDRLQFGVSRDLLELMKLPILNGKMARTLFNAGFESLVHLANSDVLTIENVFYKAMPFESEKVRDGESELDLKRRTELRSIWITGKDGLTEREAAEMLVNDARDYLRIEMGLTEAKWHSEEDKPIQSEEPVEAIKESVDNNEMEVVEQIEEESKPTELEKASSNASTSSVTSSDGDVEVKNGPSQEQPNQISLPVEIEIEIKPEETAMSDPCSNEINVSGGSMFSTDSDEDLTKQNKTNETFNVVKPDQEAVEISENNSLSLGEIDFSCLNFQSPEANKLKIDSFKLPNNISKELITSLESAQLNLSNTSLFSASIVKEFNNSSDNGFSDSFTLKLSSSSTENISLVLKELNVNNNTEDKNEKSLIFESNTFLEKAFCSSFRLSDVNRSDDFLGASYEEEITLPQLQSTRKRPRSSGQMEDIQMETPTKKTKQQPLFIEPAKENVNVFEEKLCNFNDFEIINICKHDELFEVFSKEIQTFATLSIAIGCTRFEKTARIIGQNIVKTQNLITDKNENYIYQNHKINGFSITCDGSKVCYLSLDNKDFAIKIINLLKKLFSNEKLNLKMFDSREQLRLLKKCCGIHFNGNIIEDPKVSNWLIDPEEREKSLHDLALAFCPEAINISKISGNSRQLGSVGLETESSIDPKLRASVEVILTWHVVDALKKILEVQFTNYSNIYDVEMKTLLCLHRIESNGMGVSKMLLQKLTDTLRGLLNALEKQAFSLAGRKFSFTSPTEVAKVLGMFKGKKVSTSKKVLEQNTNPISPLILQWRKLNCILTKMIFPLIRVSDDNRIYGFHIQHTATGRISMHEPNLQSLAKDFDTFNPLTNENVTISCRSAFTAAENFVLISADYCQLELRILAHLSADERLRKIVRQPGDVFKYIAARWNDIPEGKEEDEVDTNLRQSAKQMVYGIIYGMGCKSLAEQLGVDENDAAQFMESFKNTYPGIKSFIKSTVDDCRKIGFVQTLFGRRRFLPNINHTSASIKAQAERQAVNTTVQGSAADIAKKAMVTLEEHLLKKFSKTKNKPKLVLHLHDELIYEVPVKYMKKVAKYMKKYMENAVELSVPFPVKLKTGTSWGEMTELIL